MGVRGSVLFSVPADRSLYPSCVILFRWHWARSQCGRQRHWDYLYFAARLEDQEISMGVMVRYEVHPLPWIWRAVLAGNTPMGTFNIVAEKRIAA